MEQTTRTARHVIAEALSARREELSGEASPLDHDGARQVLRALEGHGYIVVHRSDVQTMLSGGSHD